MKKIYLLFFFLLSVISVKSTVTPELQYLGIENGLSNNAVTSIFQDSRGFMWFGTFDGLNRYDGYSFKVFRNRLDDSTSLIYNWITAINEDRRGNILVGTGQGAVMFSNITASFSPLYYRPRNAPHALKISNAVSSFETSSGGDIFIGTAGKGLLLSKNGDIAVQVPLRTGSGLITDYYVQSVKKDISGRIWLFIQGEGMAVFDARLNTVKLVDNQIRTGKCIQPDLSGNIWIGSEYGLYRFNIRKKTLTEHTSAAGLSRGMTVTNLFLGSKGNLWIATDGEGIGILNVNSGKVNGLRPGRHKGTLTSAAVYAVFQDRDLRMWIGTLRGGINLIDQKKNRFTTISHDPLNNKSIKSNFILSFCQDGSGNLWVGTDGDGLNYWNRQTNFFKSYVHEAGNDRSLSNNYVTRILKDSRGVIWVATYGGGINRVNIKDNTFIRYPCYNSAYGYEDRNVWTLYEDSKGNLWAGTCTNGSLYRYNRDSDRFELYDANLKNVLTLYEDSNGSLWAGTFESLIKINFKDKKHRVFPFKFAVRTILEDSNKNFWIGTEGGGLLNFNRRTGSYIRFTEAEGLPGNAVLNLLEDNSGNLWLSTFSGLSKFNLRNKKFKNFYASDGLQSNEFNYNAAIRLSSGEFAFGGIKGFNIFYPERIIANQSVSPLLITGIKVNNIPIEKDTYLKPAEGIYSIKKLKLPYDKAVLSVDFATLEYTAADKIRYAYFLEGWDKDWNYSGNSRTANYSRLQEGHYRLRIKSTNAEGLWVATERTLEITVLPPWWRSWWAYLFYIAAFVLCIYAYLRYQKKEAHLLYEVKLANLQVEQEKELNEKKLSFFTHVAHEFRTPLTLIINPVKEMLYSQGRMIDSGELTVVYRNSRRLLSLVDQLLLFRKAESEEDRLKIVRLNLVDLCKEVFLCFSQQANSRKIKYGFLSEQKEIDMYVDREKMEVVLFNLIANALKFTPDGGSVSVEIKDDEPDLRIIVKDTGCGIPGNASERLFTPFFRVKENSRKSGFGIGLYLVKKFVKAHCGRISYTSKCGEGTQFELALRKGRTHFNSCYVFEDVGESSAFLEELIPDDSREEPSKIIPGERPEASEELVSTQPVMVVVDDNPQIRHYILQIFEKEFQVFEAENGDEGLALIKKYQPDIVISDVVMTGMTGIELCTVVKEDPSLNHIPFILLTASSSSEIKLKGIEGGADDYITKPFEKELLMARVAGILRSRSNLQKYFFNEVTLRSNDFQISSEYSEFLNRCIKIIEAHLDDQNFNIKVFASEIGMSHSNLYKKVKSISGRSVNEFMRFIRLRKAAELLIKSDCNVNEAAFRAGFNDIKYFREQFFKLFEMKPSEYMKKYRKAFANGNKLNSKVLKD
ncbi:two-component regulator propeller domain-containing protein [Arcticibacter tournemirensis]|uniref:histidine kinase n=1 Tax=Arcticibacter tournemirensis TaxID=699437 RepID=A0A4Q0MFZ0_9SPHI|nr:two-component regulator propeller domain-containing protein [Arcticibacter tournemirensis]RXF72441.1 hybrid sensor histidine kinase/response regulator [Arcticibacter tournemirensis]